MASHPRDLERVRDDLRVVEPLLRKVADHEIQTTKPLSHVVTEVLHLASAPDQAAGTVTFGDDSHGNLEKPEPPIGAVRAALMFAS